MFTLSLLDKKTRDTTWDLHADEVIDELCHAYSAEAADLAGNLELSLDIIEDEVAVDTSD